MKIKFYFLFLIVILITITSCSKKNNLKHQFNCKTINFSNIEEIIDMNKQFKLKVPKHWNTRLYFDNNQTQIYSADTTKQLSQTYILDISFNNGELILNEAFKDTIIKNLTQKEQLKNLQFQFDQFKEKPSLWLFSKGKNNNLTYHYFQLFVLNSPTNYYEITTKIYGDKLIEERLCESISFMDEIEFLK